MKSLSSFINESENDTKKYDMLLIDKFLSKWKSQIITDHKFVCQKNKTPYEKKTYVCVCKDKKDTEAFYNAVYDAYLWLDQHIRKDNKRKWDDLHHVEDEDKAKWVSYRVKFYDDAIKSNVEFAKKQIEFVKEIDPNNEGWVKQEQGKLDAALKDKSFKAMFFFDATPLKFDLSELNK